MGRTVVLRAEGDSGLTWAATVIMERRSYLKQSMMAFALMAFASSGFAL